MRGNMRKLWALALSLVLSVQLCGCSFGFGATAEELYRLPRLPEEYESLEVQIDALLADGASHTAPASGSNLQSLQMMDLD